MSTVPFSRQRTAPLPPDIAKKLPCNLDAERTLLGAILVDARTPNVSLQTARAMLVPDDFSIEQNRRIFRNILSLADAQQPLDIYPLIENLQRNDELEKAGGSAYVGSLIDGMPRLSNVDYYVALVKEKATLRQLIYLTQEIQDEALRGGEPPESVLNTASKQLAALQKPRNENPIVVVPYSELLTLELPKAEPLIDPLVTVAGTFMIFSWAGWGKSWLATEMAFRVAKGVDRIFAGHDGPGGHWPIFGPLRTLYLYGEMHGERIRERLKLIARAHNTEPDFDGLAVVSKDYQRIARAPRAAHAWRPCIGPEEKHRKAIEDVLFGEGYKFLVLDNVSTLWSAAQEDQSHQVAVLKDWFIDLNARGITVFFLQHAGKGGDFLGDSAQVHILDSYIKLEHPGDYRRSQGLRCIVTVEKLRHELRDPHWGVPFEVQLVTSPESGAEWLTKPATEALKKSAFEMFCNGAPPTEVLRALPTLRRATLYRWHKEWKDGRSSDVRDGDEE